MGTSKHRNTAAASTPYDDPLFKILLLLVAVVGVINLIIFASFVDTIPSMHLPSMLVPSMHLHDPAREGEDHRDTKEMTVDSYPKIEQKTNDRLADADTDSANAGDNDENNEYIKKLLEKVGVELTPEITKTLPPWSSITAQYGPKPIIHGLETCETFRSTIPNADAFVAPAGMFNTGTNLIAKLLINNCYLPEKVKKHGKHSTGMRLQVPWGKHVPADWRLNHESKIGGKIPDQTTVLPVVMVKDPYHWMGSMCRHPYTSYWERETRCPKLIEGGVTNEVTVLYLPEQTKHESLVGLWNDFYTLYDEATYPRLIVRYEDLLFYPEYVTSEVCKCAGGLLKNEKIQLEEDSAKDIAQGHRNTNGLVSAIARYGDERKRVEGLTDEDRSYAEGALSQDLVDKFGYKLNSHVGKMANS